MSAEEHRSRPGWGNLRREVRARAQVATSGVEAYPGGSPGIRGTKKGLKRRHMEQAPRQRRESQAWGQGGMGESISFTSISESMLK